MGEFKVRRDYSINNIPVVGYQDSADAQDVILWAVKQVTETGLTTNSSGILTVGQKPIINVTHINEIDGNGMPRERELTGENVTVSAYHVGNVDGKAGEITLYEDAGNTTIAMNKTGIDVTYYTLVPLAVDQDGKLQTKAEIDPNSVAKVKADTLVNQDSPLKVYLDGGAGISDDADPLMKVIMRDYVGWHPMCSNPDTEPRNAPFDAIKQYAPMATTAFNLIFNGTNWQRKREACYVIKKDISSPAGGTTVVWTPATGKKFRLMKFTVSNHGAEPVRFWFKDGPSVGITADYTVAGYDTLVVDFGQGIKSTTANNTLGFASNASPHNIGVMAMGVEE